MYKMNIVLATPDDPTDEDVVYPLEFSDKKALHKVEAALWRGMNTLIKLTEHELETGKKPFPSTGNRTMVTFDAKIHKDDGSYFGGYHFDWPNQQVPDAVVYLKGMLDGLMKEVGHGHAKQRKPKGKK